MATTLLHARVIIIIINIFIIIIITIIIVVVVFIIMLCLQVVAWPQLSCTPEWTYWPRLYAGGPSASSAHTTSASRTPPTHREHAMWVQLILLIELYLTILSWCWYPLNITLEFIIYLKESSWMSFDHFFFSNLSNLFWNIILFERFHQIYDAYWSLW